MTDTIKLIIEIPKETYLEIREGSLTRNAMASAEIIQNGIPLDENKGEWKEEFKGGRKLCSNCGVFNFSKYKNFCPNCGADMRGKDK